MSSSPAFASAGPGTVGPPAAAPPSRLTSLDGLRGLAALVVVLYHLSLIARPILETGSTRLLWQAATETPLKLAFAGTEAVLVFFALSGLVVALPALRAVGDRAAGRPTRFSWAAFVASRLVRLYIPVWGALLVTTALIALVPRTPDDVTDGAWITESNAAEVGWSSLLAEASLTPASYDIVNVLWSLRWELAFALLLPVFLAVALAVRRHVWIAATAALLATIAGRIVGVEALVYLPVFLLGTLLAVRLDDFRSWAARAPRPALWTTTAIVSGLLLVASWIARPLAGPGTTGSSVLWGLAGIGAAGVILVAVGSESARRLLDRAGMQWLGRISFSLYLMHVPILATLTFQLGDRMWWLVALLGLPLSLLVSAIFHRLVERPSHRLARAVGGAVGSLVARTMGERGPDGAAPGGRGAELSPEADAGGTGGGAGRRGARGAPARPRRAGPVPR